MNHNSDTNRIPRLALLIVVLAVLAGIFVYIDKSGLTELILNIDALIAKMRSLGSYGPLIVIALMTIAIVINPLPSAPIALAAGAVYGHTWGTVYIITGAELGALIAFMITRLTGYHLIQKFTNEKWSLGWIGSQNSLTVMVFVSRLLPFLSFDLVSYGAGLTNIAFWRFTLATLLRLIPASFLLAHFGGEMIEADLEQMSIIILFAGLIVVIPLIVKFLLNKKH